jgi:hypothetical protein
MAVFPRLVGFDAIMELLNFVISAGVGLQALSGYRLTKQRTLLFLHYSFVLLAVGFLIKAVTTFLVIVAKLSPRALSLSGVGYTVQFVTEILAYVVLIFAYAKEATAIPTEAISTAAIPLVEYHPISELILFFLSAYIAAQTGMNYALRKQLNAMLVFSGFILLALSHILFLLPPFNPLFFAVAHLSQTTGFILLLVMMLRVSTSR